jgi:hypothetical protein
MVQRQRPPNRHRSSGTMASSSQPRPASTDDLLDPPGPLSTPSSPRLEAASNSRSFPSPTRQPHRRPLAEIPARLSRLLRPPPKPPRRYFTPPTATSTPRTSSSSPPRAPRASASSRSAAWPPPPCRLSPPATPRCVSSQPTPRRLSTTTPSPSPPPPEVDTR